MADTEDVSQRHPQYADRAAEWALMRDAAEGESAVKSNVVAHLPKPDGFNFQPDGGAEMYRAYGLRASFPEVVSPTIVGMIGLIHLVEAQIDLPPSMEYLYEDVDGRGTPIEEFHKAVTRELLTTGRYVLLADAPPSEVADAEAGPRLVGYSAESLINWDEDRSLFVLNESGLVRDGFFWERRDQWRVLQISEGVYQQVLYDSDKAPGDPIVPQARGGDLLGEVPVVVANTRDLFVRPDLPPLLGVARSAFKIFRLDADYQHELFMSGQETFVVSGLNERSAPRAVGAGVVIVLDEPTAKAEYVGPSGVGIEKKRDAIKDERENAAALGARVFDTTQKAAESGEALRIRRGATTASIVSIAQCSAAALERGLRYVALMLGEDPESIVVKPNLNFVEQGLSPQEALQLVQVWQSGAISYETLYENLQRGAIASAERDAGEEQTLVESEGGGSGDLGEFSEEPDEDDDEGLDEVTDEDLRGLFSEETLSGQST